MNSTLPPPALISVVPPAPRLPSMPAQDELDALLAMFDALAERDTARRMARVNSEAATVRPPKRNK